MQRTDRGSIVITSGDVSIEISPSELHKVARTLMDFDLDKHDFAQRTTSAQTPDDTIGTQR